MQERRMVRPNTTPVATACATTPCGMDLALYDMKGQTYNTSIAQRYVSDETDRWRRRCSRVVNSSGRNVKAVEV
jgi:hypothetical protein